MKLLLGLGFALLLILQSIQRVSTQDPNFWNMDGENSGSVSGFDQFTNQTSEDMTTIPVLSNEEGGTDIDSVTSTPSPHTLLNSSQELEDETNTTSIPEFETNSPITSMLPITNQTDLNNTATPQPKTESTEPGSESFPSNETDIDTFVNSTSSSDNVNYTTAYPPSTANTTTDSESQTPYNVTFPTINTLLPSNDSTTPELFTTETTPILNRTGGSLDVRGNSDRGVASDIKQNSRNQAWGAIIGVGVAVGIVALVVYIILKQRNYRDFSHRKLVEDMPPDPVLRLENSEPLDLKYDRFAFTNSGLQGDNIQMTNFPRGQSN